MDEYRKGGRQPLGTFDVDSKMPTRTGFKYIDNIGNVSNQTNDQQPAE